MNVTAPEKKWTDHRLDDLAKKVDAGVAEADKPLDEFRGEVNERFEEVDKRFSKVDTDIRELRKETNQRFDKVEGKMDSGFAELRGEMSSLKKSLFTASVSLIVALIGCCGALAGVAIAVH
jgi:tetrahydromethanopterin S-methyltransferase subunit G